VRTHFKIIVPFYNVERWATATVNSVRLQEYSDYECVFIDDMSDDNSASIVSANVGDDKRLHFIKNEEKKYALGNTIQGIEYLNPAPEDVIMVLDGDDWFSSPAALTRLSEEYKSPDCWMTYGSYLEYPSGVRGKFAQQLPEHVIEQSAFRSYPWCTSQLRTFKHHLWRDIEPDALRDEYGALYTIAGDLAYMFPMLEMTGHRSRYIEDILYIYNLETPLNDHKKDNQYQVSIENEIRNKQRYILKEKM
jgi:glycosyltransferase involved in cell wall biosynthesis